jgi:hypothetical protein
VTGAADKGGSAVQTQVSVGGNIDMSGPDAIGSAPAQPWHALGPDPREATATQRARRQGLALMALSSILVIGLLAAAWLFLRSFL